jgi:hypothetical protein
VFFGAGNMEGAPPVFGDVLRKVRRGRKALDSWLPGSLPANRPARREILLKAFRAEILPAVSNGGTLFLFVGDHGSRSSGKPAESVITLWDVARDPDHPARWRFTDDETLGVSELRAEFERGLGRGRVLFCMTQCHSGGFHYLSIPHELAPNRAWFQRVPAWVASVPKAPAPLRIAGFTATDELSVASGCDAEPTEQEWEGYERALPERLLGVNLLTGKPLSPPARSLAEAHDAAVPDDRTVDNPFATSEQFLERWATLIETRLAWETNLVPRVRHRVEAFFRALDGAPIRQSDRAFRERETVFRGFTRKLAAQLPEHERLVLAGTRADLIKAGGAPPEETDAAAEAQDAASASPEAGAGGRRGRVTPEMKRLWNEVLRPAWISAVGDGSAAGILGAATDFEQYLLLEEQGGRELFFARRGELQADVFWHSGYWNPQTVVPEKAEAVVRWGSERRSRILSWARNSSDAALRAAAAKLTPARPRRPRPDAATRADSPPAAPEPIGLDTAASRVLFYRRVLAAWDFLLSVNERPALARLQELREIEKTVVRGFPAAQTSSRIGSP